MPGPYQSRSLSMKTLATWISICALLGGCTRIVTVHSPLLPAAAPAPVTETGHGWWEVRFRSAWDGSDDVPWHLDPLIADQIIAPILGEEGARITLWRIHRRAVDDGAGHRLSFIFYSDASTAESVSARISAHALAGWLRDQRLLSQIELPAVSSALRGDIAATSDANWPVEIQRSWPWFIMGVSQHWLALIREARASSSAPDVPAELDAIVDYYREINEQVSALWREQGQHAYLHHLNALFDYQPLVIRDSSLRRF
jgi:hypothetical protein